MRTSTVTVTPLQSHYQVTLRDIHCGSFCLYHDQLYLVGYESLVAVGADMAELIADNGDFCWDDPCTPVDAEVSYSVVTD